MAKILLIDDDAVARGLLAAVLGDAGHECVESAESTWVMVRARSEHPDLIMINPLMLGINAYEFVRRVRQDEALGTTPVLFHSASREESELRVLADACGVSKVISGSVEAQQILEVIHASLLDKSAGRLRARAARAGQILGGRLPDAEEWFDENERLIQAQKLETIGWLAGGVAHNLNNILSVILGNATRIQETEGLPPSVADSVHQIALAAEQASVLARQILKLDRRHQRQPGDLDLDEALDETLTVLKRVLGRDNEISADRPVTGPSFAAIRGGKETILVVEDQPLLRSIVRKILERYGYRVLAAESATGALDVWKDFRADVRLLLTDLVLPNGMSGRDLAARLSAESASLKVIYTSGLSAGEYEPEPALKEGVNFLQKPYDLRKLCQVVRSILDSTGEHNAEGL